MKGTHPRGESIVFQCVICSNWFPEEEGHRDVIGQTWPWDNECEKLRVELLEAAAEIWEGEGLGDVPEVKSD